MGSWIAGQPKVFHSYFLTGGGLSPDWKTISVNTAWDPTGPEDEDAVLQRIISEAKSQIEKIRTKAALHYALTSHPIQAEFLTWAVYRHFDEWSYEQIGTRCHHDAGTVQNRVTVLLGEIGLGRRRGRPSKNSQE